VYDEAAVPRKVEERTVRVEVPAPPTRGPVAGVVTDAATGRPLADVVVELRPEGGKGATGAPLAATADGSGSYRTVSVAPGSYKVHAHRHGYEPALAGPVQVVAGREVKQDLSLKPVPAPGVVEGNVVDEDGKGVPAVVLPAEQPTARTGADPFTGAYRLELAGGSYGLQVRASGFEPADRSVTLPAGETQRLDIMLKRTRKKKAEVRIEAGVIEFNQAILFDFDRAVIKPESHEILKLVAQTLTEHPEIEQVEVEGHTDAEGEDAYNQKLSERRAGNVRRFLVDKGGVAAERVGAKGYGEAKPIADNSTPEGRARNRRVVFRILRRGGDKPPAATPASTPEAAPAAGGGAQ